MPMSDATTVKPVSTWRKVLAVILDLLFVGVISGYAIAYFTGDITAEGFNLQGAPAFAWFAVIVLYFGIFTRYLGGTIWQRLLRVR
jgi:hypothetical protein